MAIFTKILPASQLKWRNSSEHRCPRVTRRPERVLHSCVYIHAQAQLRHTDKLHFAQLLAKPHWQPKKKKRNLFNCMESSVQFPAIFCAVENLCLTTAWCCLCLRVCVRACQVGWQAVRLPWLVRELFCLNQLGPPVSLQSSQCRPHGPTPLWKVPLSLTQLDTHTQTGWHIECKP